MLKKKNEFLEKRDAFAKRNGKQEIYEVIDHWPLYAGVGTLSRNIEILDIFRSIIDVPGDIAEFGSNRGANLVYLAKLLEIHGIADKKKIHCFESFEGLTRFAAEDGVQDDNTGRYKGSLEHLQEIMHLFSLENRIAIHKGFIQETLPPFLKENPNAKFSLLYYDADLYEPCKLMIELLEKHVSPGGVMVFDEYGLEEWPGETRAVDEFLATTDQYSVEKPKFATTRRPGLVLRKRK